ncbi:MAG: hypothetical protein GY927_21380 [bacterium]|nr:hypothetical protein [bacterium]
MWHLKYILAASFLGLCLYSVDVAAQTQEVPKNDTDIDDIIWAANRIHKNSLPACLTAHCIKIDCGQAGGLWEPLLTAYQVLGAMGPALLKWRGVRLKQGMANLTDANRYQDRVDHLRDVQLIQDSLSTVYATASEIASTLDFKRGFKESKAAWKTPTDPSEMKDRLFAFLKHFKDAASRIEAYSKAPKIGKNTKQTITWKDFGKSAAEAYLRARDVERILKKDGLKSPKLNKAVLSQFKDVLDMSLKMDREARQVRLSDYVEDARRSFGLADESIRIMRRINERRRKSLIAMTALRNAMNGLGFCYQRKCVGKAEAGQLRLDTPDIGKPNRKTGVIGAMKYYDKKLRATKWELSAIAKNYSLVADYESELSVGRKVLFTREVFARYRLQRYRRGSEVFSCVPEGSELKIYRRPYKFGNKAVMSLGDITDFSGTRDFKVQQDISGTWKARKAVLEVEIALKDGAITLTRKNIPIDGRDRVYSGTLKRRFSEPGKYTILFEDSPGEIYLPAKFEVVGRLPASEKAARLISTPKHVDDISPKVPRDIRDKLIKEPHKQTSRYRVTVTPHIDREGKLKLKIALYNHRIKFKKKSRKVESVKEKLWFEGEFERVE